MENSIVSFAVNDSKTFKIKMLNWCARFNIFCFLDNHDYAFEQPAFDCILAAGSKRSISLSRTADLQELLHFYQKEKQWIFGHLGFELLNPDTPEKQNQNEVSFDDGFFFVPEIIIRLENSIVFIDTAFENAQKIFKEINAENGQLNGKPLTQVEFNAAISETDYKDTLRKIKKHILRGDCYEINFCQHFFSTGITIDPLFYYYSLSQLSPNPFAAFYKLNDKYCLCASPERFLKRTGNKIISQPIKGTSKRYRDDIVKDEESRKYLSASEKERTENVMIVDLVRNDLSKICTEGSVRVKELFGVYSFPQVHQMISTVEGELDPATSWTDIIEASFPMGSMTGAPKKRVIELIELYEQFPRGLFSGSIGYVTPTGDFDFNVVIRSLMYDETKKIISFKVGGGITFNSDVDKEYEECLLKAEAIIRILKGG